MESQVRKFIFSLFIKTFLSLLSTNHYISTSAVNLDQRDSCQLTFGIWHSLKQWAMISFKLS